MPNGRAIVFTDKLKAEIQTIDLADPGPGEFITRTLVSLISTGTECICFRAESDPGSHWDSWVKHPFNPGYSNVGEVIAVGEGVDQVELGQRIFTSRPHHEFHCHSVSAGDYNMIPDAISNEEATWAKLATISQTGVRRAEVELGDSVVVVGLGPLGLLITQ
ncbi:MAG: alcohol dehydrogenase catalytic domain-containing protein, partial [Lentisphaeria bacterium]|nr:alcohol dehydrogenase catalytic domain-containing protein [Lentisphaeria bacterium]